MRASLQDLVADLHDVEVVTAWHGTQRSEPFSSFDPRAGRSFGGPFNRMGSWFASTFEAARVYARPAPGQPPGRIYEVRLLLRTPWVFAYRDGAGFDQLANYIGHAAGRHGLDRGGIPYLTDADIAAFRARLGPKRNAMAIEGFREGPEWPVSTVYVVFDPADIRIVRSERYGYMK